MQEAFPGVRFGAVLDVKGLKACEAIEWLNVSAWIDDEGKVLKWRMLNRRKETGELVDVDV